MKTKIKILILIISVLLLSSCDGMIVHMDGWATPVNATGKNIDVNKYEYDGHTYLVFGLTTLTNGITHDPDCKCNL